jgi:hypothetical protein
MGSWSSPSRLTVSPQPRRGPSPKIGDSSHADMAQRCAGDAERITRRILAFGVMVENQSSALCLRDLDAAQKIISGHPIMRGWRWPGHR